MQDLVQDALGQVHSVTQDEINQLARKTMKFKIGDFEMPFVAEDSVQSFSTPNFISMSPRHAAFYVCKKSLQVRWIFLAICVTYSCVKSWVILNWTPWVMNNTFVAFRGGF